ncbi:MAG: inorganic phosphate transporter [Patescibacteria group bacterium]|nr:inorganic phosphate transporter [Patescibacteria group bacterium]
MTFELLAVITLIVLALGSLMVGVVNDAVNFLNSAIGAKAAPRKIIMLVAAAGVMIGATFSDGIIEVARKGIFHPEFFTLNEAIIIFTGAIIANIVLLDLFSTFGLPTSTTVSIVFALFGAALSTALLKTGDWDAAWEAINSASAVKIMLGILLSVGFAFAIGVVAQFITRLIFTFDYARRFNRFGFLWSGVALSALVFFILIKGGKHATFMTDDLQAWISTHTLTIMVGSFVVFSLLSLILIRLKVNVLKFIILIGTGSLAMAFAGNDLANFIGVTVAGVNAYLGADLAGKLPTPTWVLLVAGAVMVFALYTSKKSKTVIRTEINLASHDKDVVNSWRANLFAEKLAKMVSFSFDWIGGILPKNTRDWIASRFKRRAHWDDGEKRAYDLIRASVNLMVAAAVISYATSYKLPLSTTYVTFMVAMGTSLADGAWDRSCAPARITGVLTVVSGWFLTAFIIFFLAAGTSAVLYLAQGYGLMTLLVVLAYIVYKLLHIHDKREKKHSLLQEG